MGEFFAFIFGLIGLNRKEHNEMDYYYDDEVIGNNIISYREPDITYSNVSFDGGDPKTEEDYKSNKVTDII